MNNILNSKEIKREIHDRFKYGYKILIVDETPFPIEAYRNDERVLIPFLTDRGPSIK